MSAPGRAASASHATPRTIRPDAVPVTLPEKIRRKSGVFWMEFMYFWTDHFPPIVLLTKPFFLFMAWRTSNWLRHGTLANARRLLGKESSPEDRRRLARGILNSFYLSIYELGRSLRLPPARLAAQIVGVHGREHFERARTPGKGAILVTAHLGPFELGMAALQARNERIHVVFQADQLARFESLRRRLRSRLGVVEHAIDPEAGAGANWSVWVDLRDALLRNEVVMIQGDRIMPGQRGVPVPFADGHMLIPTGPVKLSLATGAPLIPVFSYRIGLSRLVVEIMPSIEVSPHDGRIDESHPAVRAMASAIERQVLSHPEQWLMVRPMWYEDQEAVAE